MELFASCVLCLLAVTSASEDPRRTEVILGRAWSTVALPCSLRPARRPAVGYQRRGAVWSWSRPSQSRSLASAQWPLLMVGSDGVVKRGRRGPAARSQLPGGDLGAGDFSLLLREARPGDSGTFHCSARLGPRHLDRELVLHVVEVSRQSQGPAMEGSSVSLRCDISEGLPEAQVSWFRQGSEVRPSTRSRIQKSGRILTIQDLKIEDGGLWECRVKYKQKEVTVPYDLKLFGFSRPKSELQTVFSSQGSHALLSLPLFPKGREAHPLEWGWLRGPGDRTPINVTGGEGSERFRAGIGDDSLELSISPVQETDRGNYTGYLSLNGWQIERTLQLELIWVRPSHQGPLLLGSPVRLQLGSSFPEGFDAVSWSRENGSWVGEEGGSLVEETGALLIPSLSPQHTGRWQCEVFLAGKPVGSVAYELEASALAKQAAGPSSPPTRTALVAVTCALLLLAVAALCGVLGRTKCHRRDFPALEVTLSTVEPPLKKV